MPTHTVEFVERGETLEVDETETILSRALEEGVINEYSCRVGMCLACCSKILEGDVTQPAARALTDEQAAEYALTCMARPQSDLKLRHGEYPPSIDAPTDTEDAVADD